MSDILNRAREREQLKSRLREQRTMDRYDRESQRRDAANTGIVNRLQERTADTMSRQGYSPTAVTATRYGDSYGQFADRRQQYMTNDAQRGLARDQGYAARRTADAAYIDPIMRYRGTLDTNRTNTGIANIEAGSNRYVADRGLEGLQYQTRGDVAQAQIGRDASMYGADRQYDAAAAQVQMQGQLGNRQMDIMERQPPAGQMFEMSDGDKYSQYYMDPSGYIVDPREQLEAQRSNQQLEAIKMKNPPRPGEDEASYNARIRDMASFGYQDVLDVVLPWRYFNPGRNQF